MIPSESPLYHNTGVALQRTVRPPRGAENQGFPRSRGKCPKDKGGLYFLLAKGRGAKRQQGILQYFTPKSFEAPDGRPQLQPEPAAGPKRP